MANLDISALFNFSQSEAGTSPTQVLIYFSYKTYPTASNLNPLLDTGSFTFENILTTASISASDYAGFIIVDSEKIGFTGSSATASFSPVTPYPSITPTTSPTPSITPSITVSPSVTPSVTITSSITPSITVSPSVTQV